MIGISSCISSLTWPVTACWWEVSSLCRISCTAVTTGILVCVDVSIAKVTVRLWRSIPQWQSQRSWLVPLSLLTLVLWCFDIYISQNRDGQFIGPWCWATGRELCSGASVLVGVTKIVDVNNVKKEWKNRRLLCSCCKTKQPCTGSQWAMYSIAFWLVSLHIPQNYEHVMLQLIFMVEIHWYYAWMADMIHTFISLLTKLLEIYQWAGHCSQIQLTSSNVFQYYLTKTLKLIRNYI